MKLLLKILSLNVLLLNASCLNDIDFNQAESLKLEPVIVGALINFNITQNNLAANGTEITSLSQKTPFIVLDNDITEENLQRIVFRFEIENQFNRDFQLELIFLDNTNTETHEPITLNVLANQTDFIQEEEIIIADNPDFTNSRNIQVDLALLPSSGGTIIDTNIPASLIFKSAATFYLTIN